MESSQIELLGEFLLNRLSVFVVLRGSGESRKIRLKRHEEVQQIYEFFI